jgi:hypothetical protein
VAIRFDASGDYLSRTTGEINPNNSYTWHGRVYINTLPSADACIFGFDGVSMFELVHLNSSNQLCLFVYNSGATITGSTLSASTWYDITIVRESVSSCKVYLNNVLDITSTYDITGRDVSDYDMFVAAITGGSWALNCRQAGMKIWSKALAIEGVKNEIRSIIPRDPGSIWAYYPMFPGATERLLDYSGNGRDWTANGSLTDEAGPPVPWGFGSMPDFIVPSGAPTLEQEGFRARADDGDEDAATWLASQDANFSRGKNLNTRLRFILNATNDPPAGRVKFVYRRKGDTGWRDLKS